MPRGPRGEKRPADVIGTLAGHPARSRRHESAGNCGCSSRRQLDSRYRVAAGVRRQDDPRCLACRIRSDCIA
jgi:hypothetical protein